MEAPLYPHRPIYSLKALSLALAEPEALLVAIAKRGSNLYRYVPQKKEMVHREIPLMHTSH